jgi:hypothetical protein
LGFREARPRAKARLRGDPGYDEAPRPSPPVSGCHAMSKSPIGS